MMCSPEQIERAVKAKGYAWFTGGNYNLNIVGIRNAFTGDVVTNWFDDHITLTYSVDGSQRFHIWPITTDPGIKGVIAFQAKNGVARLKAGQYRGAYQIGLHRGRYKALVQRKPVTVWRDANKDTKFDEVATQTGMFGINIHKAGRNSVAVDDWSHGCQVFKRWADYNQFIAICEMARSIYGNSFTYTLLDSDDIK